MRVMFDTVTDSAIPSFANTSRDGIAGYLDGRFENEARLIKEFPNAHHLGIDVHAQDNNGPCLDVEPGDATNAEAPGWVKRAFARGVHRPILYTSLSNIMALVRVVEFNGIKRQDVKWWCAHYTKVPHLCSAAHSQNFGLNFTVDGTQWTDRALGRNLDESLVVDDFFDFSKPVPVVGPINPHYDWFDNTMRDYAGLEISERGRMMRLDTLIDKRDMAIAKHESFDRIQADINQTKAEIHFLFDRLWQVVHTDANGNTIPVGDPTAAAGWELFRRNWRGKQLWLAANGKRRE